MISLNQRLIRKGGKLVMRSGDEVSFPGNKISFVSNDRKKSLKNCKFSHGFMLDIPNFGQCGHEQQ